MRMTAALLRFGERFFVMPSAERPARVERKPDEQPICIWPNGAANLISPAGPAANRWVTHNRPQLAGLAAMTKALGGAFQPAS
jgi:hypothetical protein